MTLNSPTCRSYPDLALPQSWPIAVQRPSRAGSPRTAHRCPRARGRPRIPAASRYGDAGDAGSSPLRTVQGRSLAHWRRRRDHRRAHRSRSHPGRRARGDPPPRRHPRANRSPRYSRPPTCAPAAATTGPQPASPGSTLPTPSARGPHAVAVQDGEVSVEQAAAELGIPAEAVYNWLQHGQVSRPPGSQAGAGASPGTRKPERPTRERLPCRSGSSRGSQLSLQRRTCLIHRPEQRGDRGVRREGA